MQSVFESIPPPLPLSAPPIGAAEKHLKEGNKLYKEAFPNPSSPEISKWDLIKLLKKAATCYRAAVAASGLREVELLELSSCARNLGLTLLALVREEASYERPGPIIQMASEGIHSLVVASGAGKKSGREAAWVQGVEQNLFDLVRGTLSTLKVRALDSSQLADLTGRFSLGVWTEGGGAQLDTPLPFFARKLLQGASQKGGSPAFTALAASLHTLAARSILNSVVSLTEKAGMASDAQPIRAQGLEGAERASKKARFSGVEGGGKKVTPEEKGLTQASMALAEKRCLDEGIPQLIHANRSLDLARALLSHVHPSLPLTDFTSSATTTSAAVFPSGLTIASDLEDIQGSLIMQSTFLESRRACLMGEAALGEALEDGGMAVDTVFIALDHFKQAEIKAYVGGDLLSEAIACAKQGHIYDKVLKLKEDQKAYEYCAFAVTLAFALAPMNLDSRPWLIDSKECMRSIQTARQIAEEKAFSAADAEVLVGCKPVTDAIDAAAKMGCGDFLKYIYKHHRVIKNGVPVPDLAPDSLTGDNIKKTLFTACCDYHPDKQHTSMTKALVRAFSFFFVCFLKRNTLAHPLFTLTITFF